MEHNDENIWKINMIKELTEVKQNELAVIFDDNKMSNEEIEQTIKLVSTD